MAGASRERTTLDLRGLGPAIRAYAKARNTTASAVARLAVVKMLESSDVALQASSDAPLDAADGQAVKVTVRVARNVAREMATRARASGLSHGAYLSKLIAGAPAPAVGVDHKHAVATLAVSTDRLAAVVSDLNELARLVRRGVSPSAYRIESAVATLAREVRAHLVLAARLLADLQPIAAWRRDASQRVDSRRAGP